MLGKGIRIGSISGIRIGLDFSLIVIFLLLLFNLGAGVFPAWHPDWSMLESWVVAFFATVIFFASILAHELAHSLVARAYGIPIRNITLFLFGGVSSIEREPDSPKVEALMAIIGPITSIVLGFAFAFLAELSPAARNATDASELVRSLGPVGTLLAWLGPINIFIGLFNLIPAFPLDGGRVLRAIFWASTDDIRTATRWAARVGQAFGWLLIVFGIAMVFGFVFPIIGGGFIGGIWMAFIGWFLSSAASASYRELIVRDLLADVPVSRLMRRQVPAPVEASLSVDELVDRLMSSGERLFPVRENGAITAVVTSEAVRKVPKADWISTPIRTVATPVAEYPSVSVDADAYQALRKLATEDVDELLVVDSGGLAGVLRRQDVARWIELHSEEGSSGWRTWHTPHAPPR